MKRWQKRVAKPSYTYFWTHALPGPDSAMRGAFHGSEINYVFGNLDANDRPWTQDDRRIADIMSSYWANIAKSGDPNGPGLPHWSSFDPDRAETMELGDKFGTVAIATPAKRDFWRRFFASNEQW